MIRKFDVLDIDKIMLLWLEANFDAHYFIDKKYWLEHFEVVKQTILDTDNIYVYEEDYQILGFIGIIDNYIAGIFVNKNYRCQKIGYQLINFIKESHKHLRLSVYQKNQKAVNFYLKENFKIVNENFDLENNEVELIMEYKYE